jgi:hypothetical protein
MSPEPFDPASLCSAEDRNRPDLLDRLLRRVRSSVPKNWRPETWGTYRPHDLVRSACTPYVSTGHDEQTALALEGELLFQGGPNSDDWKAWEHLTHGLVEERKPLDDGGRHYAFEGGLLAKPDRQRLLLYKPDECCTVLFPTIGELVYENGHDAGYVRARAWVLPEERKPFGVELPCVCFAPWSTLVMKRAAPTGRDCDGLDNFNEAFRASHFAWATDMAFMVELHAERRRRQPSASPAGWLLHGPSFGLAVTLAAWGAAKGLLVPPSVIASGRLTEGGGIGGVNEVPAKHRSFTTRWLVVSVPDG